MVAAESPTSPQDMMINIKRATSLLGVRVACLPSVSKRRSNAEVPETCRFIPSLVFNWFKLLLLA